MDYLDHKYILLISASLEKFKITSKNPFVANFRCPVCGDSKKKRNKARGYLVENAGEVIFHCHNCSVSHQFDFFLGIFDQSIFQQYRREKFMDKIKPSSVMPGEEAPDVDDKYPTEKSSSSVAELPENEDILKGVTPLPKLPLFHHARKYVKSRKIPEKQYHRIYFCSNFMTWINSIIPDKFENTKYDHARLIFFLKNKEGRIFGCSARAFDEKQIRYITIMFEDRNKVFGEETVDKSIKHYILEGPIDSLFLDNSMAMVGTSMNVVEISNENSVFVFDNQPRNRELLMQMEKIINSGKKTCIWPESMLDKDINDLILSSGMSEDSLKKMIDDHTFSGIKASLKFASWKKI